MIDEFLSAAAASNTISRNVCSALTQRCVGSSNHDYLLLIHVKSETSARIEYHRVERGGEMDRKNVYSLSSRKKVLFTFL